MALTSKDLNSIKILVESIVNPRFEAIEERIAFLPTKEEFYNKMDEFIGEVKEYRQERTFLMRRLDAVENKV